MDLDQPRHGQWPSVGPTYPGDSGRGRLSFQDRPFEERSRRPRRGRGRGRGSSAPGGSSHHSGARHRSGGPVGVEGGQQGRLTCGFIEESAESAQQSPCSFRTNSNLALTLHRADRHLIYPPGGKEELDRIDPLLVEERKEAERRRKRSRNRRTAGSDDADAVEPEAPVMDTIPGLNIALSTPELVQQWIAERKKRWPSDRVVRKRLEEAWEDSSRGQLLRKKRFAVSAEGQANSHQKKVREKRKRSDSSSSSSSCCSSVDRGDGNGDFSESSDSNDVQSDDSEAPSEEPVARESEASDKVASSEILRPDTKETVCHFYLQGRCNYGSKCKQLHQEQDPLTVVGPGPSASSLRPTAASRVPANRRPRPRPPPANPFEPRNLLHALLKTEIAKHISSVAQVVRFLVRNDFLHGVELQPGDAMEQARRRKLVQAIPRDGSREGPTNLADFPATTDNASPRVDSSGTEQALPNPEGLQMPPEDGAYPTLPSSTMTQQRDAVPTRSVQGSSRALYRPPSPTLRPLTSLQWPPEPDPLIFLDPLRRDDPKPLTRQQFEALTFDWELRRLLASGQTGIRPGLKQALITLDSLPSDEHRRAALELILGVSLQTPVHPHQVGNTFVTASQSGSGGRFIGEVELFRLGLRVGHTEQIDLQKLAQRVSDVVDGSPEFDVEPQGWDASEEGRSFREEKRRRFWEKEADRRDLLRKLGLDVD